MQEEDRKNEEEMGKEEENIKVNRSCDMKKSNQNKTCGCSMTLWH